MAEKQRVLTLCTGISARSRMAEGLPREMAGDGFEVGGAGMNPSKVRPESIEGKREVEIDISGHRSKSGDEFTGQEFDYIVTVCDNANETWAVFRRVREEIREWLRGFITKSAPDS